MKTEHILTPAKFAENTMLCLLCGRAMTQLEVDSLQVTKVCEPSHGFLAARCHKANAKWWQNPATSERIEHDREELMMLMVSELSEAVEGCRKDLQDDKLPQYKMEEVEIADFLIRLYDFAGAYGYNLHEADIAHINWSERPAANLFRIIKVLMHFEYYSDTVFLSRSLSLALRYARQRGYTLWPAFEAKMQFNAQRADHTHKARLAEGGKQF